MYMYIVLNKLDTLSNQDTDNIVHTVKCPPPPPPLGKPRGGLDDPHLLNSSFLP